VLFEREHCIDDPTFLGPANARASTPKRAPSEDPALAWSDDTTAQDHFRFDPKHLKVDPKHLTESLHRNKPAAQSTCQTQIEFGWIAAR